VFSEFYTLEDEIRAEGKIEDRLVTLLHQIKKKKKKSKPREKIIDELELEEQDLYLLDNFESYKHLIPS
jgi:uncharacterized Fe-S cluster-containing protein